MTTVLQVSGLQKAYRGVPVLTDTTFHLASGERVGLVGVNGCGKSTVMKLLAGREQPDDGRIRWLAAGVRIGYLSQEGNWDPKLPLGRQMGPVPEELLARCGVTKEMLARRAGTLSGGQKTRAALARVLADRPEVLLLDEPTNHLDTAGLDWLERVLTGYRGTVLVVSHDRYFLDRVVTRILELEDGKVREYPGNYSAYARQKREELERARAEYEQYLKEKRRLEASMQRLTQWAQSNDTGKLFTHNAYTTRVSRDGHKDARVYKRGQSAAAMRRVKAMEKRLERARVERPKERPEIRLRMDGSGDVGRNLILAEGLGFTYDGRRWIFRRADFFVQRGDRVAIIGPNGAGKSTLIRLILGQLQPTEGALHRSPVKVAYLAQEMENLDPARSVLEEVTGSAALEQAEARGLLGCLLFADEEVLKPVGVLSGGEKVRVALAKILLSAPDLLVLDEPTNGLDLPSRERVEEALERYGGTMLLVSHDRYLLRRLATRILAVDGGRVEAFPGDYESYLNRASADGGEDLAARRLLLETRLSELSARLAAPPEGEAEALTAEFIRLSRELRALREAAGAR